MNRSDFPKEITVTKVITYDVDSIIESIKNINNGEEITEDDIIAMVQHYAKDDFSCGWGHEASMKDLIFTDEEGNEW